MRTVPLLLVCILWFTFSEAQDSTAVKTTSGYLHSISGKLDKLQRNIYSKTSKTLRSLQRRERKLYRELLKKDSAAARLFREASEKQYAALQSKLNAATGNGTGKLKEYLPAFDTLHTSISFLAAQAGPNSALAAKARQAGAVASQFGQRMQAANEIRAQLRERQKAIGEQFERMGMTKTLRRYQEGVYYYQEQLKEYKALLADPGKPERKAMEVLRNSKAFQGFMKQHSMLAQLFKLPEGYGSAESLAGLQTRAGVDAMLAQRLAGAGQDPQQYVQQQVAQAQGELNKMKQKLNSLKGGSSGDIEMPQGFKPNTQKTKSFLKRIEYGADFQTQKMNGYFPVTTDIALTVGYKLNDKSVLGIGASYKMGWGSGIEHIRLTHEGAGLRSYIDWKLKGNLWISGGYEQNYLQRFTGLREIQDVRLWRQSAMLGLTKKISIGKKKSKVQLLYDFFYTKNNIRTQPLVFRVGYGF